MRVAMVIPILHFPQATKGCHTFLHGEAILLAPFFLHSPFSILGGGMTTPIVGNRIKAIHIEILPFTKFKNPLPIPSVAYLDVIA